MARIKIQDYINNVESCRQKLIKHARNNSFNIPDNSSLNYATDIATQNSISMPDYSPKAEWLVDPAVEGPFDSVWVDLDGAELFKETVSKNNSFTQFTGEPGLHKQFPDILEWTGWTYNGSLESAYRDALIMPTYNIKSDESGDVWSHFILNVDITKKDTFTFAIGTAYGISATSETYVDWGDGSGISNIISGNIVHTYVESGIYDFRVISKKSAMYFSNLFDDMSIVEYAFIAQPTWNTSSSISSLLNNAFNLKCIVNNSDLAFSLVDCASLKVLCCSPLWLNSTQKLIGLEYLLIKENSAFTQDLNIPNCLTNLISISLPENTSNRLIFDSTDYVYGQQTRFQGVACNLEKLYLPQHYNYVKLIGVSAPVITIPQACSTLYIDCALTLKSILAKKSSLTYIESCSNCYDLEYLELPDTLTTIGKMTENASLRYLDLPDSVTTINQGAFSGTYRLEFFRALGLRTLPSMCFYGYNLKYIYLGNSLRVLESNSLYNCYVLENLSLGDGISEIKSKALDSCRCLKNLRISGQDVIIASDMLTGKNIKLLDLSGLITEKLPSLSPSSLEEIILPPTLKIIEGCIVSTSQTGYPLKELDFSNYKSLVCNNMLANSILNLKLPKDGEIIFNNKICSADLYNIENINNCIIKCYGSEFCYYASGPEEIVFKEGSVLPGTCVQGFYNLKKLDFSKCDITSNIDFKYSKYLHTLDIPSDFNYNIDIHRTAILKNSLSNIVNKLKNLTSNDSKIITITTLQNNYLIDNNLIDILINKNWTISINDDKN